MAFASPGGKLGALIRVPVDYILEARIAGAVGSAMALPNTPSELRISKVGTTDLAFTITDAHARFNDLRNTRITLSGRSGVEARSGQDGKGLLVFQPGPILVEEFDRWLDNMHRSFKEFQELQDERSVQGLPVIEESPEFVFRAYNQRVNLKVVVESFEYASSAGTSRHSYEWSLTLKAYGDSPPMVPLSILSPVSDWAQKAAASIDDANAYVGAAGNALTNLRKDLDILRAPLLALERTAAAMEGITDGLQSVAEWPRDAMGDLVRAAGRFGKATQSAMDTWDFVASGAGVSEQWRALRNIATGGDSLESDSGAALGGLGGLGLALDTGDDPLDGQWIQRRPNRLRVAPSGARAVPLLAGDDLRAVAYRELGSRDQWTTLAWLNGWKSPTQKSDGSTPQSGTKILIPADNADTGGTTVDPMGTDLYVDPTTKDLEFQGDDLRSVGGDTNAVQALRERLTVSQGDWPLFPAYGIPLAPGDALTEGALKLLAALTEDQLRADYRVVDVLDLAVVVDGAAVYIDAMVNLSDGQGLPLIAPLPVGG
jgi:hypothetical protein